MVNEVKGGGVSEERGGCLGWVPRVITRLGERVVSYTLRQPAGVQFVYPGANPGRMEGED